MTDPKRDPWHGLTRLTPARIALGRAGGSIRTESLLEFRLAHARARDAVQLAFDADAVERQLSKQGLDSVRLSTLATDRRDYLLHPERGRALTPASQALLEGHLAGLRHRDLVIVVSDGLSALAAERQAASTLSSLMPQLTSQQFSTCPIFIVPLARVKLADEIGQRLGARLSLILLGERPGLSSPDSLGAYITYDPGQERTDAERNCVSNIRPEGLSPFEAARRIAALLVASKQRALSGVTLRVEEHRLTERR